MPCYATGTAEGDARLGEQEARAEVTKLTRLLCTAMHIVSKATIWVTPATEELEEWWEEHQMIDRRRKKEEHERESRPAKRATGATRRSSR
jgi:hypothetical protein